MKLSVVTRVVPALNPTIPAPSGPVARHASTPWSAFTTVFAEFSAIETRGIGSQRIPTIDYVAGVGAPR